MHIAADQASAILTSDRGNPQIVGRNWPATFLQFLPDLGIVAGRIFIHRKEMAEWYRLCEPGLVTYPGSRLPDTKKILAKYHCRQQEFTGAREDRLQACVAIGECR